MFSGNIVSGIAFDRCDSTHNADSTVATETLYRDGKIVGVVKYEYSAGLQVRATLTGAVYTTPPSFIFALVDLVRRSSVRLREIL